MLLSVMTTTPVTELFFEEGRGPPAVLFLGLAARSGEAVDRKFDLPMPLFPTAMLDRPEFELTQYMHSL